jgi:hypothetical protein
MVIRENDGVHVVEPKRVENSNKFRQAALHFQKYGYYTASPVSTSAYLDYWREERKRCLEGYYAEDGDWISGYHYFYLNYCPILLVREEHITDTRGNKRKVVVRKRDFPDFWDSDYDYFLSIEMAEREGKHIVVLKARGKGYSFKGGSMLCRNFFLIKESNSYAIASEMEYLTKDGLLSKAWEFMDFIDQNTAWAKKRQKTNTKTHRRASYMITDEFGVKSEAGYKSEIMGISLKNDPDKARGKRGKLILWEEGGKFPDLVKAWQVAQPSVEREGVAFGLMVAYGTGGTEEADYEGLKELFLYPDGYNALPFKNIWDDGGGRCGYFVPEYVNMYGVDKEGHALMDDQGNTNYHIATRYALALRDVVLKGANDRHAIDRYIAEHPFNPTEACLQIAGNIFPKEELIRHLAYLKNSESLSNHKQVGDLDFGANGKLVWTVTDKPHDIIKYRLRSDDNKKGQIVIWEHPPEDIPHGLYIAACDPYDHDQAATSDSLGSVLVYKRFQNFESYYDILVAEYTGRPTTVNEFYENVRRLMMYYNAKLLYENDKPGLFAYFANKHCEHILADQPDIIRDIIKDSSVQRKKGIHASVGIKDWAELKARDWLSEEYEPGKKNLNKLLSEPLIEELISYNREGNFDRVDAFLMLMVFKEELHNRHVKKIDDDSKSRRLFATPLFKGEIPRFINL